MEKLVIRGGKPLVGEVSVSGAKNAAVAILPATILAGGKCVIENLPDISDVAASVQILHEMGAQVRMLVDIVDERDIPVICYGLRTDFRGELFEGSRELLCWADTIEEIKTVCWCGRKATFNARVQDGRIVREGEQILLGGNSQYISLCRKHWKSGELGSFRDLNLED